jgi:formate dehydrogenase maturation protein FdhE
MKPAQVGLPEYDARIRRAELLTSRYPFAAEVLHFYSQVAKLQRTLYADANSTVRARLPESLSRPFRSAIYILDDSSMLTKLGTFLGSIVNVAPGALVVAVREISKLDAISQRSLLHSYWEIGGLNDDLIGPFAQFVPRAFSEPLGELRALHATVPPALITPHDCPLCGGRPMLGVLRPEGDGGKRRMLCSFCLQEWDFRRIYCPACGEEDEKKLPVYVAEQFPHIRVEACETCKTCIRTIDLTKDGNAVPVVDDLAAIPLTLWAQEHDYTRLHPNLLGT